MSSEFEDRGLFLICVLGLDYPSLTPIRFLCVSFSPPPPHSLVCIQILNRMMAILPTQNSSLYYGSAVSLRDRAWRQNVCPSVLCFFFLFTYFGIFFLKEVAFYCFNFKVAEELENYKHELLCALVPISLVACHSLCVPSFLLFAQTYAYVCKARVYIYIYCAKRLCIYACMYTYVYMHVYIYTLTYTLAI